MRISKKEFASLPKTSYDWEEKSGLDACLRSLRIYTTKFKRVKDPVGISKVLETQKKSCRITGAYLRAQENHKADAKDPVSPSFEPH